MDVNFRDSLLGYIKDGVLDKSEIESLNKKAAEVKQKDPFGQDTQLAKGLMSNINKIKNSTNLSYDFTFASKQTLKMNFTVTPTYSELEKIRGNTMSDAITNISQSDNFQETTTDDVRCATSTVMDIAMRYMAARDPNATPEQVFAKFATKVGVSTDFTYENVHKAQDKLHNYAKQNVHAGLMSGYSYSYNPANGKITNVEASGDVTRLAGLLDLKLTPLIGTTVSTISDKKESIDNFLKNNPKASIMVGVYQDDDGNISKPDATNVQNHMVEVYQKDNSLYIHNTGMLNNGENLDFKLTDEDKQKLLYTNTGTTIGVIF